jgi:hypothetical protein
MEKSKLDHSVESINCQLLGIEDERFLAMEWSTHEFLEALKYQENAYEDNE